MTMNIASDKQLAFIDRLSAEKKVEVVANENMTTAEASALISSLLAAPTPANPDKPDQTGIYRDDAGEVYKVQQSKTTGNLYAMKLTPIGGNRLSEDGKVVHWTFVYEMGAIKRLTRGMRLTLAQAQAFGIQYGVCIVCGKTLTDAKSIARGIGPVCGKRV
jgi:hypothetical protein